MFLFLMINKKTLQYETYIVIGFLMVALTLAKLIFHIPIDSDWFWCIAGIALVTEGSIDLSKQRQFSKKYKVISKKEFNDLWSQLENKNKK
jgi:hypothetical protein